MEIDRLSPFQYIRIHALENAVNQLSPNDTVESILETASAFEKYIISGEIPAKAAVVPLPSTGRTIRNVVNLNAT